MRQRNRLCSISMPANDLLCRACPAWHTHHNPQSLGEMNICATALKKVARSPECAAAACLFKQLAVLFASPSINNNLRLETKQLDGLMTAFKQAPVEEVATVSQILKEILAFLSHLDENSVSTNKARARVKVKPAVAPEKAAKT